MNLRHLKVALVVIVALEALIYAAQNVANLGAAYDTIAYVLAMADNVVYSSSIVPAMTNPALVWVALLVILTFEFGTGLVAAKGALDLWAARSAPAADFNAAKTTALLGCGLAVVTWFGLFIVIGGGAFQMWQTDIGRGSMEGAMQFAGLSGLAFLIVNAADQ